MLGRVQGGWTHVCLEGAGRGGSTLTEHFAAASASGLERLRYVNHENLLSPGRASEPCFKVNPYLAARLGLGGRQALVAGPSILYSHFSTPESFRRKYLAIASSPVPPGLSLFELSPSEEATVGLIRRLEDEGADLATIHLRLDELHETMTAFSDQDVELLAEAGLVMSSRYRVL